MNTPPIPPFASPSRRVRTKAAHGALSSAHSALAWIGRSVRATSWLSDCTGGQAISLTVLGWFAGPDFRAHARERAMRLRIPGLRGSVGSPESAIWAQDGETGSGKPIGGCRMCPTGSSAIFDRVWKRLAGSHRRPANTSRYCDKLGEKRSVGLRQTPRQHGAAVAQI